MEKELVFWILCGAVGFAFALAVQMRIVTALVLRRALLAWNPAFEDRTLANAAVKQAAAPIPTAADGSDLATGAAHLQATYPNPLQHLRTARRFSLITPVLLLLLIGLGRTVLGVIG